MKKQLSEVPMIISGPKSLFGQITVTLVAFAVAFLIMLGVAALYYSNRSMERQMLSSSSEVLAQAEGSIDQLLDDLSLMLHSTFMGPDVIPLAISPNLREFENMKTITSALTSSAESSSLIDSAFLYSSRSDLGLSSDYTLSNYQDYSYSAVLARFQTKKNKLIPYEAHDTVTYYYTENNDIYLIQGFSNIKYEKCSCYILFHLDSEAFHQAINATQDNALIFYNSNGMQMFRSQTEPETTWDTQELYQQISQMEDPSGQFVYDWKDGTASHIIYRTNQWTGWVCVYVTEPVDTLTAYYLYSNELLFFVAAAIGLCCLLAIFWSAKRISRPISSLIQKVQSSAGAEHLSAKQSEWEYLELTYSHLLSQKEELEHYLPLASDSIHERLFHCLFRQEEIHPSEIRQQLELIRSSFHVENPCAVILSNIELTDEKAQDQLAKELAVLNLKNELNDAMQQPSISYYIGTGDYADVYFVCSFPDASTAEATYPRICEMFSRIVFEGGKPIFGFGDPANDLTKLYESLADARNKLEFNQYHSDFSMLDSSEEREQTLYVGEIRNLLTTIRPEDTDRLASALLKLLYNIDENVSNCSIKRQLYQILIDLLLDQVKIMKLDCSGLNTSLHAVTDDELCQATETICGEIVNSLCSYFNSGQYLYINRAKEYILTRCNNPNLSLESTAEYVGINSAYLSRIFKTIVHQNFTSYLNACRVENAKKLLSTTDMPAQEIGYLTGFCSVATFFRVFKKHTNMTPKQFRQGNSNEEVAQ